MCAALLSPAAAMAPEDASSQWEEFYLGSRRFQFVAESLGMPIDQVTLPGVCGGLSLLGDSGKGEKKGCIGEGLDS